MSNRCCPKPSRAAPWRRAVLSSPAAGEAGRALPGERAERGDDADQRHADRGPEDVGGDRAPLVGDQASIDGTAWSRAACRPAAARRGSKNPLDFGEEHRAAERDGLVVAQVGAEGQVTADRPPSTTYRARYLLSPSLKMPDLPTHLHRLVRPRSDRLPAPGPGFGSIVPRRSLHSGYPYFLVPPASLRTPPQSISRNTGLFTLWCPAFPSGRRSRSTMATW
jgi:hypothetical protein